MGLMSQNITLHVRFYIFGTFLCRPLQNNNVKWPANFRFSGEREPITTSFVFRFLCFNTVHSNLGPGQLTSIFHVKQTGIIAKELKKNEKLYFEMTFSLPSSSSLLKVPTLCLRLSLKLFPSVRPRSLFLVSFPPFSHTPFLPPLYN